MTSLVSGGVELLSSPLQSDLTRKVRKTNLSVATLRIIILFFFSFFVHTPPYLRRICRANSFLMMTLEVLNSVQSEGPSSFRTISTLTLLVGTDNVTEKTRAIIRLVKYLVPSPLHDKRKDHGIFGWLEIRAHQMLASNVIKGRNSIYLSR